MHTFQTIILALAGLTMVNAGALLPRQLLQGGLQCNIARLQIVGALGDTSDNIADIQDATVQQAAAAGVDQANSGISQIASALLAGEAPPAEGRDITEAGLTAANEALSTADASDPAVAAAQESLDDAIEAGQKVVAQC